jgi:hypothetical protein
MIENHQFAASSLFLSAACLTACFTTGGCVEGSKPTPESPLGAPRPSPLAERSLRFSEEAESRGVIWTPVNGQEAGHLSILETLGCGVGLLDFDADGDLDLFTIGGGRFAENSIEPISTEDRLFANDGAGHFVAVPLPADIRSGTFYSHGVEVGDIDADGFPDLITTGYDGIRILTNMGDGTFRSLPSSTHHISGEGWHSSAALADFNNDGHLDLYCVRYVDWSPVNNPECTTMGRRDVCPPAAFHGVTDRLFISEATWSFREYSRDAGIEEGGKGLGVVAADLDLDGTTDLYVANDTTPNRLYQGKGDGSFVEAGLAAGVAVGEAGAPEGSMGTDVGDPNLDGLPDIWVANFENESFGLYRNFGGMTFENISSIAGISAVGRTYVGFGTMFLDVDLDGAEDLFVSNGHVMVFPTTSPVRQHPLLFHNLGRGKMANVAATAGEYFSTVHMGRGAASGDLDGDGDEDLVVSHTNEPAALLINQTIPDPRTLMIRLIGTRANRDCIGASATLQTNTRTLLRQVTGGGSYLSASSRELLWGLAADEQPVSLSIRWPGSGTTTQQWPLGVGRFVVVESVNQTPIVHAVSGNLAVAEQIH